MSNAALSVISSDPPEKWQEILADLITDPKELTEILQLDSNQGSDSLLAQSGLDRFSLKVPRPFARRMQPGNWDDPLLRQVWPSQLEDEVDSSLSEDPLQERSFNQAQGLLQKYRSRVLLTAAPHCAVHCRYCFRRHFDYAANTPGKQQWQETLGQIGRDSSISEVILSGGDPLAAGDNYLKWLLTQIDTLRQITTIRIHTRLPVVIPQRITRSLCQTLASLNSKLVIVIHCNHGQEIDSSVQLAMQKLRATGATLMNQSVLLKGINDDAACLVSLSHKLFDMNVLPYYLHLPDRVAGTGHFLVDEQEGLDLITEIRALLPGYLVPRLVREDPGCDSKTRLG